MFFIEHLDNGEWKVASEHTQLVDAQMQWERFMAGGGDLDNFRKSGW